MTSQLLSHAIIGCGRVAPNHVAGVRESGVAQVAWACDRDRDTAAAFARAHGIPNVSCDVSEVLGQADLFSVSIAVDHAQHAPLARAALLAGKHVLVEKPTALSLADAHALTALAEERRLRLATIAQHRFDPLFVEIKRLVDAGALGPLVSLWATLVCGREPSYYADSYWRGTWQGEGGSLFINQAYHCIDLMVALAGRPTVLSCQTSILKLGTVLETEDVATATFAFPGGALGSLGCTSATSEFWRSRIDVVGAEGSLTFDINHPGRLHHVLLRDGIDLSGLRAAESLGAEIPPGIDYYGVSHNRQIADFLQAAQAGRPSRSPPGLGLDTLAVIVDLYALARRSGAGHAPPALL
jgi:predicted dehydrogenase